MLSSLFSILLNALSLLVGAVLCFGLHQCWLKYYPKPPPAPSILMPRLPPKLEIKEFKGCYARKYLPDNEVGSTSGHLAFTICSGMQYSDHQYGPMFSYTPQPLPLTIDTRIYIHSQSLFKLLSNFVEALQDSPLIPTVGASSELLLLTKSDRRAQTFQSTSSSPKRTIQAKRGAKVVLYNDRIEYAQRPWQ